MGRLGSELSRKGRRPHVRRMLIPGAELFVPAPVRLWHVYRSSAWTVVSLPERVLRSGQVYRRGHRLSFQVRGLHDRCYAASKHWMPMGRPLHSRGVLRGNPAGDVPLGSALQRAWLWLQAGHVWPDRRHTRPSAREWLLSGSRRFHYGLSYVLLSSDFPRCCTRGTAYVRSNLAGMFLRIGVTFNDIR